MDLKNRFASSTIHTMNLLEQNLKTLTGDIFLLQQYNNGVANADLLNKLYEIQESYISLREEVEPMTFSAPDVRLLEECGLSNVDPFPDNLVLELQFENNSEDEIGFFKRF